MNERSPNPPSSNNDSHSVANSPNNNNQMKAILTTDGSIKIILSPPPEVVQATKNNEKFLSKEAIRADFADKLNEKPTTIDLNMPFKTFQDESDDDDELSSEFKLTPRQVFMSTICQVSSFFNSACVIH